MEKGQTNPNEIDPLIQNQNEFFNRADKIIAEIEEEKRKHFLMKIPLGFFMSIFMGFGACNIYLSESVVECDIGDGHYNVRDWLLINGIFDFIIGLIALVLLIVSCITCGLTQMQCVLTDLFRKICFIIYAVISTALSIGGAFMMFKYSADCVFKQQEGEMIYAFVFWIIQLVSIIVTVYAVFKRA
jgi:hypothetical protein